MAKAKKARKKADLLETLKEIVAARDLKVSAEGKNITVTFTVDDIVGVGTSRKLYPRVVTRHL